MICTRRLTRSCRGKPARKDEPRRRRRRAINNDAGPGRTRDRDAKPELRRRRRRANGGLLRKTDDAAEPGRVLRPRRCCRHQPGARAPPSPSCTSTPTSWTPRRNRLGTSTSSRTRATPPSAPRARAGSSSPTIGTATLAPSTLGRRRSDGCCSSRRTTRLDASPRWSPPPRRVAAGRTDAEAGVVAATGESPVVRSRFYAFIKAFLVVSLLLLAVEVAAYFNGWDLAESAIALPVIGLESLHTAWLRFHATYVAPGVQFLTDARIVLFLIQSADRLIQCLGCFYIHIKRIKPKPNSPALPDAEDPDAGYYPMVLVQIPMCNEKEVYQQSIAAVCNLDWPWRRHTPWWEPRR
ncbi:hypothetical protein U9M48_030545 [Paspalum notatum var. saurae]|uniref:Glycosyltransferase 2-like domain-containing protein n=1 Tax=Paspalum notatum var. saurae TaxID=547442 RepID=A0AAQ3U5G7_PASNO